MPVGFPNDPEAHAVKIAAAREAKVANGGKPVKKRTYKRRTLSHSMADVPTIKELQAMYDSSQKTLKDLDELNGELVKDNERLRDREADAYNRLMAVLDLVVNQK